MHHVALALKDDPPLVGYHSLPKYEFVQDIEETPDIAIQETTKSKALLTDPVDSFWFFEIDTPKVEKSSKMLDLSHLGAATATIETSSQACSSSSMPMPDVPIATPGTYQLFLPDPEMMDRIGGEVTSSKPPKPSKPAIIPDHSSIPSALPVQV